MLTIGNLALRGKGHLLFLWLRPRARFGGAGSWPPSGTPFVRSVLAGESILGYEGAQGLVPAGTFWFAGNRNPIPPGLCHWGGSEVDHKIKAIASEPGPQGLELELGCF